MSECLKWEPKTDLFVLTFMVLAEVLACQMKLSFFDSALLF